MIDTFWSLGLRLKYYGLDNPFTTLKQAHMYDSLDEAKDAISKAGHIIAEKGLPKQLTPLIIGFTGYGNVSVGAQELCALIPVMEIPSDELLVHWKKNFISRHLVYKVVFKEEDMVEPKTQIRSLTCWIITPILIITKASLRNIFHICQ